MSSLAVLRVPSKCIRCDNLARPALKHGSPCKYCEACLVAVEKERQIAGNQHKRAGIVALRATRQCQGCEQILPPNSRSDKKWCDACRRQRRLERSIEATREYRRRSPEYFAAANLKWRMAQYGLTVEQANTMLSLGCAVCGTMDHLRIDHNHETGKVRGVLCHTHNAALGMVHDKPEILRALATYLEERDG